MVIYIKGILIHIDKYSFTICGLRAPKNGHFHRSTIALVFYKYIIVMRKINIC